MSSWSNISPGPAESAPIGYAWRSSPPIIGPGVSTNVTVSAPRGSKPSRMTAVVSWRWSGRFRRPRKHDLSAGHKYPRHRCSLAQRANAQEVGQALARNGGVVRLPHVGRFRRVPWDRLCGRGVLRSHGRARGGLVGSSPAARKLPTAPLDRVHNTYSGTGLGPLTSGPYGHPGSGLQPSG